MYVYTECKISINCHQNSEILALVFEKIPIATCCVVLNCDDSRKEARNELKIDDQSSD